MSQYSNADVRNLMTSVFEDEEDFEFFLEDHFPEVIEQIEDGMSFKRKAQVLAKYCQEKNLTNQLIAKISADFPDKFAASGLPLPDEEASPVEAPPAPPEESEPEPAPPPAPNGDEPPEKPAGQDVFISYSRRDEAFVKQLYQYLMSKGVSTWYDRVNIEAGTLWRESIVDGITNCKVFLLVLSPDATASDPVRREISLAQGENKPILPIMWRQTEFPKTIKYQLAGIQYIDFANRASQENFEKSTQAVKKLLGDFSVEEVASDEPVIAPEIASVPSADKPISTAKRKQLMAVQATRRSIASMLITPLRLETDTKERYSDELGWLFTAADHLLQVRRGDASTQSPVPADIPATAGGNSTNTIQDQDEFSLKLAEGQVTSIIKQINIYLRNLNIELRKLAQVGGEDHASVALINSIYSQRKSIVERIQELAELMYQTYGVQLSVPDELFDELAAQQLG